MFGQALREALPGLNVALKARNKPRFTRTTAHARPPARPVVVSSLLDCKTRGGGWELSTNGEGIMLDAIRGIGLSDRRSIESLH
jgi:hypothetical protein